MKIGGLIGSAITCKVAWCVVRRFLLCELGLVAVDQSVAGPLRLV